MKSNILEGQISIFDVDVRTLHKDFHMDREGRKHEVPSWMKYERCENCSRWAVYTTQDQPPSGWGIYGWCTNHKNKCSSTSYCMNWEDKHKLNY